MRKLFAFLMLYTLGINGCSDQNHTSNMSWSPPEQTTVWPFMRPATNDKGDFLVVGTDSGTTYVNIYRPFSGWLSKQNVGLNLYSLSLAMNDAGQAVYVYVDGTSIKAIRYSPGSGWSAPELIANLPTAAYPQTNTVIDSNGGITVVWTQSEGQTNSSVQYSNYSNSQGWSVPINISNNNTTASNEALAVNESGRVMLLWRQFDGATTTHYKSVFSFATGWSNPEQIYVGDGILRMSQMDKNGNVVLFINSVTGNYVAKIGLDTQLETKSINSGEYPRPLTVSMNKSGHAFISWGYFDGLSILGIKGIMYSPDTGWDADTLITDNGWGGLFSLDISGIDDIGNMMLAVSLQNPTQGSLGVMHYNPVTGWGQPVEIATGDFDLVGMQLTVSPNGTAMLLWETDDLTTFEQKRFVSFYR